jgi:hypothetical protein
MAIANIKYHKTILNKILADERLMPNRKLLAGLVKLYLDSTGDDKHLFKTIILGEFLNNNGIKLYDSMDTSQNNKPGDRTLVEQAASANIKSVMSGIFGEDNG